MTENERGTQSEGAELLREDMLTSRGSSQGTQMPIRGDPTGTLGKEGCVRVGFPETAGKEVSCAHISGGHCQQLCCGCCRSWGAISEPLGTASLLPCILW
jgi:hypothetical protein